MNMQKLLRQAQQVQEKMQRELGETQAEASVGGGMVVVKMDGHKHVLKVRIDSEILDPEDPEMLEDLIVSAVNEASRKTDDALREKLGMLTANMPSIL